MLLYFFACSQGFQFFCRENICHIVKAPADVPWKIRRLATDVASKAISSLEGAGVFAVEMFLTRDGQVVLYFTLINIVKYLLYFICLYSLCRLFIQCIPFSQILLNEVAPRPHNSGHHTIESCYTSQFEQHLRAVVGLPLGDPSMKTSAAIMYNLLGEDEVHTFVFFFLLFQSLRALWMYGILPFHASKSYPFFLSLLNIKSTVKWWAMNP